LHKKKEWVVELERGKAIRKSDLLCCAVIQKVSSQAEKGVRSTKLLLETAYSSHTTSVGDRIFQALNEKSQVQEGIPSCHSGAA
jgi:hypothetical protein